MIAEIPSTLSANGYYPIPVVCGLAGQCELPCCNRSNNPEQLYITFGEVPLSMRATWITYNASTSMAQWGTSPDSLDWFNSDGSVTSYTRGGWRGVVQHVTMKNLHPRTRYYYRVGDGALWSNVSSFVMPDLDSYPLRVAMVADLGVGKNGAPTVRNLMKLVDRQEVDWVMLGGDNGYSDGNDELDDVFGREMSPLISRVPYVTIPGNHELFANFTVYRHRFPMAHRPAPGVMYWAFDSAGVRFIGLDGEAPQNIPKMDNEQLDWLKMELQTSAARKQTGKLHWIMVTIHRPLYCTSQIKDCSVFAAYLRERLEDLFYNYGVDLVFQAHTHNYERSTPLYRGAVQPAGKAPVYIVNGFAGSREGDTDNFSEPGPPWRVTAVTGSTQDLKFGFAVMIVNATTLHYRMITDNSTVIDDFVMTAKSVDVD